MSMPAPSMVPSSRRLMVCTAASFGSSSIARTTVSSQPASSTASLLTSAMYSPRDFAYAAFTPAAKPMFVSVLSWTMISAKPCDSSARRHCCSIGPRPMSTTMAETSVMAHPVEVHRAGEAAQLDAALAVNRDRHDVVRIRRRRRKRERARADLNRRAPLRGVAQMCRPAPGQKRHRVAGTGQPPYAEDEPRHLVLLGEHRSAAMGDVRVFEVDAIARAPAEIRGGDDRQRHDHRPEEPSRAKDDQRHHQRDARHERREVGPDEAGKEPREVGMRPRRQPLTNLVLAVGDVE